MRAIDTDPFDQIFSHTDFSGVTRHFNATAIIRAISYRRITPNFATLDLIPSVIDTIEKHHGVDQVHLDRLTDDMLSSPILIAEFNDGANLVIDGNHRIVKRFKKGFKTVDAVIVNEPDWTPYLVTDVDRRYSFADVCEAIDKRPAISYS